MIGRPLYSIAMYEKVKRFTIAFENGLLFISTEIDVDDENLISKLQDILGKLGNIL